MIRATSTPADRPLPAFPFRWDAETEILSGRQTVTEKTTGFTGSWELESATGAVVVLETEGGVLCGIEVVVWPDVERAALVVPHDAPAGRVVLEPPSAEAAGVLEVDTPITGAADASETLVHLGLGSSRAQSVRIAGNVVIDLSADGHLVGLWLQHLPPFPQGE
jgi:hypothetical protein